jgi:hypothetical protein
MMIDNSIGGINIHKGRLDNIKAKTANLSPMDGLMLKTS